MSKSKLVRIATIVALAAIMVVRFSTVTAAKGETRQILITDDCEPVSFNAVFPGVCSGNGRTTFDKFIAQLTKHQNAFLWMFTPREATVKVGETLSFGNTGGETHTFTKVEEFGGGFLIPLNDLSGNPTPAPECSTGAVAVPGTMLVPQPAGPANIFVEAGEGETGPTAGSSILPAGQTVKFQCCIHPWMRMEVTVK